MSAAECLHWTSQHPVLLHQAHPANDTTPVSASGAGPRALHSLRYRQRPHPSHHPRRAKRGSRDEGGALSGTRSGGGLTHQSVEQTYSYAQRPHAPINLSERTPNENTNYDREVTYDESGNQTGWTFRGQNRAIEWNEDDQIKRITKNGQELNRTLYDARGQKAVHLHYVSGMEETAYLGPNLTIRDGKYLTKHVYVGDQRVSSKMDPDWFQYPPTLYFHPDHLGSTQYASNDEQTLIQHDEFFPSGEPWRDETDSRYELARRFVFTGKELDIHTGLYDYGARSYDARMGVWLSPDPVLPTYSLGFGNGGVHTPANLGLYTYVYNRPIVASDPDGRLPHMVVGALIGFGVEAAVQIYRGEFSATRLTLSTLAGAATGGVSGFIGKQLATTAGATVVESVAMGGLRAAANAASGGLFGGVHESTRQIVEGEKQNDAAIVAAAGFGALGGGVGSLAGDAFEGLGRSGSQLSAGEQNLLFGIGETTRKASRGGTKGTTASVTAGETAGTILGSVTAAGSSEAAPASEHPSGAVGASSVPVTPSPGAPVSNAQRQSVYRFEELYVNGQQ